MRRPATLAVQLTVGAAKDIAGVLGQPSKLPGYSYGLDANRCHRGSELRKVPGSVCASCYAMNDFYATWRPVKIGHERRHRGLVHPRWCDAMVTLIQHYCRPPDDYFRWHDSGDLQGLWHLVKIAEVCERTPGISHWLPTREYGMVDEYLANGNKIPDNLVVRLSAEMVDSEPDIAARYPRLAALPTSTVQTAPASVLGLVLGEKKGWIECRAVEQRDNTCGPCRACWDGRVANVSYPQH